VYVHAYVHIRVYGLISIHLSLLKGISFPRGLSADSVSE